MKHPRNSSVVIVGVAKNLESILTDSVARIMNSFVDFKSIKFHIVESNSKDFTAKALQKISNSYENLTFESITDGPEHYYIRTRSLSIARNRAQEFALNQKVVDYVAVADLDGINSKLTRHSILSNWQIEDWDMVSANQPKGYYDLWALRHPILCPNDCWKEFEELERVLGSINAFRQSTLSHSLKISSDVPEIPVQSAFGGIAIYTASSYAIAQYQGIGIDGKPICEHVPFNSKLSQSGFKLFINPRFINVQSSTQSLKWGQKIKHQLTKKNYIVNPRSGQKSQVSPVTNLLKQFTNPI